MKKQSREPVFLLLNTRLDAAYIEAGAPTKSHITIAIYETKGSTPELYTENFEPYEFRCKCKTCKRQAPHPLQFKMVARAQAIRDFLGRPTTISSAWRCEKHHVEAKKIAKGKPVGYHGRGRALDIKVAGGAEAGRLIHFAITVLGCTGFSYYAESGFVHLDWDSPIRTWNY